MAPLNRRKNLKNTGGKRARNNLKTSFLNNKLRKGVIMGFQEKLGSEDAYKAEFPSTRYQGSKNDISNWIWSILQDYEFDSLVEPFSGTAALGFEAKRHGKKVIVNDILAFNHRIGRSIIENSEVQLTEEDIEFILERHEDIEYPTLIQDEFEDIYFTDEENKWLDKVVTNIRNMEDKYKRAIAFSALGQACLTKRPYNLFHRANLYMRTQDVERSFGNKTTWEKPFPKAFKKYVDEFNRAVFDNERKNESFNKNVFDLEVNGDLVYCDPPYISEKSGGTNYKFYYHFLNGMINYESWKENIDRSVKTKRLEHEKSVWNDKDRIHDAFDRLFEKFQDSIIAVSYNTHGIPSVEELKEIMGRYKENVRVEAKDYQYALSEADDVQEVLIIGE